MDFPLTRADVEEVLVHIHEIATDKREALRARMRHLQRNKFPPGVNTGKGRAADYQVDHLFLLVIAFEMIQLGLTPDGAITVLTKGADIMLEDVRVVTRAILKEMQAQGELEGTLFERIGTNDQRVVIFDPRTLRPLQKASDLPDVFVTMSLSQLTDLVGRKGLPKRLATLDLLAVVLGVFDALHDLCGEVPVQTFHNWAKRAGR